MIKNTAEAFSGGEVDIIENFNDYSFIVKFVGVKGIPKNLALFKQMLEEIKPAHLNYELEFTYNTWDMIMSKNPKWNEVSNKTWLELMSYEGQVQILRLTVNYGLKKPDGSDVVNIDDFNYNADIIDSTMKEIKSEVGALELKAEKVTVADSTNVFTATNVEAALLELLNKIKSNTSNISANTTKINQNTSNISANTSNISKHATTLSEHTTKLTSHDSSIQQANTKIQALETELGTNKSTLSSNINAIREVL